MRDRITVDPSIHFGKPCVAGTRIPVEQVLEWVRDGLTAAEIRADYYPDLSPDDVRALGSTWQTLFKVSRQSNNSRG